MSVDRGRLHLNNQIKNSGQAHKIILGSTHVLGGTIASSVLGMFRSLIIAGGLGPSLYGAWNILMVIFTYNSYVDLGLVNGMNKEMPYLRGKGDAAEAEKVKDNTFWAVSIIATIINILLVAASVVFQDHLPGGMVAAVCILAITNILFQLYNFLICLLRTDKAFGLFGLANVLLSLTSLACVIVFFKFLPGKLYGALSALAVGYLLVSLYIVYRMKYRIRFTLNVRRVIGIFKTGFPLIIIQIGAILLISIDRWMIAGMIDQISLGYYGIGLTMANFLFAGASTVAFTLYPFMLERFGQTNDAGQSEQLVYTPIIVLSYLMAVACTLIALAVPLLITYVLPAYVPGIHAAVILIFGIYFISIMTICGNFLVSINKQNIVLYVQMGLIPLSVVFNYALIKSGLGIEGVALGTAAVYFLYGTAIILVALRSFTRSYKELLLKTGKVYFPFVASFVVYLLLKAVFGSVHASLKDDLLVTALQISVFLGPAALLAWHLNRMTGVTHMLRDAIRA